MSSADGRGLPSVTELRVHNFSVSLDGYAAGPGQSQEKPLGAGGEQLHEWIFSPDATDVDRRSAHSASRTSARRSWAATCSARSAATWGAEDWTGWWGEDPPFHHDVFVLTHYARDPVPMAGGTTFHFVTDGIEAALDGPARRRATGTSGSAAGPPRSSSTCGPGLLDELHLAVVPVLLGGGERLFEDLGTAARGVDLRRVRAVGRRSPTSGCAVDPTVFDTMEA